MTATSPTPAQLERLFVDHLATVDRIVGVIARRHALSPGDSDEFASWARTRLMDNDYAIIARFAGRSSIQTYLSVVLTNLFRDYRNHVWGRWRPSAAARRMGPIAMRLEELLSRDGFSLREAIGVLRSSGVGIGDSDLARMAALLPPRVSEREVSLDEVDRAESAAGVVEPGADAELDEVRVALEGAVEQLPHEDRLITRMRFWSAQSVADISRALRLDQKPLYRRLESIQRRLHDELLRRGITVERARDFLEVEGQ